MSDMHDLKKQADLAPDSPASGDRRSLLRGRVSSYLAGNLKSAAFVEELKPLAVEE